MTEEQIAQIIEQLTDKAYSAWAEEDSALGDTYYKAVGTIEKWVNGGKNGSLPVDLAELGIDLSLPLEVVASPEDGAPSETIDVDVDSTLDVDAVIPGVDTITPDADAAARRREAEQVSRLNDLRHQAQRAVTADRESDADDLWRQVLALDPNDLDAQRHLRRRSEQIGGRALRSKLVELRSRANSENITDLEAALQIARDLLTSAELTEEQQQQVQDFEAKAVNKRAELKAVAGEIETTAGLGNLKDAIADLEAQIKLGRFEFVDREGDIVNASDKLAEYNREYAAFCTQKAHEYLQRAERSLPAYPHAADQVLKQALDEFVAADPAARDQLQRRRTEIGELITRWDLAQKLVGQGRHEDDPEKRLALFLEAQGHYAGIEKLDELIEEARADAAAAVVSSVKNRHDHARYMMEKGELDAAQAEAMQARDRAREMRGTSAALDAELAKVDALMVEITTAAGVKQLVEEAKVDVEALLVKHEFEEALELIGGLSEAVRGQQVIKSLESQITRKRGADAVIRLAETRFNAGDYAGVLELVDPEKIKGQESAQTITIDPRSSELQRRASARKSYVEGVALVNDDPETAKPLLEHARLTDPGLANEVAAYLDTISDWETRRGEVQKLLSSAARLMEAKPPKFADAFAALSKAKDVNSPLKNQALDQWLNVGTKWREALIKELEDLDIKGDRAGEIINTLREKVPSGGREVQEYIEEKKQAHHQERARDEAQSANWKKSVGEWKAYLDLARNDLEAQEGLRRALREQALDDANEVFLSTHEGDKALALLEERLQKNPEIRRDTQFLADLVRRSCRFHDFDRAEKYLASLLLIKGGGSDLVRECRELLRENRAWDEAERNSKAVMAEGRYASAVRMLDDVINDYANAGSVEEWRRDRDKMRKQAVNSLLEQARTKKTTASGAGKIDVISLYSQVLRLDESNREAQEGLREVKGELPSMVRSIVDEALRFKVDKRDAGQALSEAELLLDKLNDFRAVAEYMGDDGERHRRNVDDAVRKLSTQRDDLQRVSNLLKGAREALDAPISDQAVDQASRRLQEAKQTISTASGITEMQEQVKDIKQERGKLKGFIEDLKNAVHDDDDPESLQAILEAVRNIRQIDPEDHYQLQTPQNLSTYDDFSNKQLKTLEEFEQIAKLRQASYRIYAEWERKCTPLQEAFEAGHEEVRDRRSRGSLEELQESLERVLAVGEHALEIYASGPEMEPASFLEEDILDKVNKWQQEVEKAMSTMEIDRNQAQSKREHRDTTDQQLRVVLGRKAVTMNSNLADRLLQELRSADPHWQELPRRERQVQAWKANTGGGLFSFVRGKGK